MRIYEYFDLSSSLICYYSFLFGLIWKSFGLSVFDFDLFYKWQIGIQSLSYIW